MGQQQLLLIVLAVILVGVAVLVGIEVFNAQAATMNVDYLVNDLLNLAARAQQYYLKPVSMGGGGNSFRGMTIEDLTAKPENENGRYLVRWARRNRALLVGVGKYDGDNNNRKARVRLYVYPDSVYIDVRQR